MIRLDILFRTTITMTLSINCASSLSSNIIIVLYDDDDDRTPAMEKHIMAWIKDMTNNFRP